MGEIRESPEVVEELFKENHRYLFSVAFNFIKDKEAARDIVQDVFLKLWKRRSQIDFKKGIRSYLFKAISNASLNYLEKNRSKASALQEILRTQDPTTSEDVHSASFKELEVRVRIAIDRLPPKCKMIFLLSRQEGMKYREIAEQLNLSVKTVENQLGIALEKLRWDLRPFLSKELLGGVILAILAFVGAKLLS